jgi:hypothetical protein
VTGERFRSFRRSLGRRGLRTVEWRRCVHSLDQKPAYVSGSRWAAAVVSSTGIRDRVYDEYPAGVGDDRHRHRRGVARAAPDGDIANAGGAEALAVRGPSGLRRLKGFQQPLTDRIPRLAAFGHT